MGTRRAFGTLELLVIVVIVAVLVLLWLYARATGSSGLGALPIRQGVGDVFAIPTPVPASADVP